MNRPRLSSFVLALALAAGTSIGTTTALGQVGTSVTYQGQLKNNGVAVNSPADVRFSIWDAATAGTQIGTTDTKTAVPVSQGLFSTTFDCGVNPYTADAARWLQIEVRNPSNVGGFVLLGARQRLTAAPFSAATRGMTVDSGGNVGMGSFGHGDVFLSLKSAGGNQFRNGLRLRQFNENQGFDIVNDERGSSLGLNFIRYFGLAPNETSQSVMFMDKLSGAVGIGTTAPTDKLHVKGGRLRVDQTDGVGGSGVMVMSNGTTDNYIYTAAGSGDLVLDTQSPADNVIVAPSGGNVGIGTGATAGTKVHMSQPFILNGFSTNLLLRQPIASWGLGPEFANYRYIQTQAAAPDFDGGFRQFNVGPGGVSIGYPNTPGYGSLDAMYVNGFVGIGTNTPSHKLTVQGDTNTMRLIGPTGTYQWNSRLNLGDSDYVRISENDDDFLDLQGVNGIRAANTFSAPAKNFRIDHPSDPANMILNHGCIESDQYVNLYRGNAVIGNDGGVWIQLPSWMNDLNTDFSYQLTSVGAAQPNLFVAVEVNNQNQFRVAGGQPGAKVSWQVTGVRHDAYVQTHPLVVEEVKTGSAAGTYLSPNSFGIYTAEELAKMGNRK